ncbi:hypothetical protein CATYP_01455 [Corynebacterium atypicum]|uniref:Thioredoxin domain-containing protein n=1 Tax=Corynebacterium atypicum TaxID=191610 RepID=A0ABM5QLE0_9CORY|nr:hypothetical protein CATYP_01455 [Corynebacterium atypicum]
MSSSWGWIAVVSAIALLAAVGVASWGLGYWQAQTKAQQTQAAHIVGPGNTLTGLQDIPRRIDGDPFALGPVDAPVVISEFSDFECPFCAVYANQTEPEILERYVTSGKVRLEWNDMPINGPNAHLAAQAGRAAAAQGKFWEFKHELYAAAKDKQGHPNNSLEDLVGFARQAGVQDLDRFRHEVEDGTYGATVDRALAVGSMLGVNGTPTFLIGDKVVSGALPADELAKTIDAQLDKAGAPAQD